MNYQVYINGLLSSAVITGTCHNLINTELDSNTSCQNNFPSYTHDPKVHPTTQYQPMTAFQYANNSAHKIIQWFGQVVRMPAEQMQHLHQLLHKRKMKTTTIIGRQTNESKTRQIHKQQENMR